MLQISGVNYDCCGQLKMQSRPVMLFPFDVWKFKLCLLLIVGFLPSQCFAFALELFQTFPLGINFWSVDISLLLLVWEPKCKLYKTKRKKRNTWSKKYRNTEGAFFDPLIFADGRRSGSKLQVVPDSGRQFNNRLFLKFFNKKIRFPRYVHGFLIVPSENKFFSKECRL